METITSSPIGNLKLQIINKTLTHLEFTNEKVSPPTEDPFLNAIKQQLQNYFINSRQSFAIKTAPEGTPFQQKVWQTLIKIDAGKTVTYSELAKQLNTSARAIGNACRKNPIPIIIPCHRVVAKKSVGGYAGNTKGKYLKIKEYLLAHEKSK